ncbi:MAG: PAS domain-containing protein, partial [Actinobacteria bacterium]|nr:PAS domain-containing protein [Actinomycetota bacterium]
MPEAVARKFYPLLSTGDTVFRDAKEVTSVRLAGRVERVEEAVNQARSTGGYELEHRIVRADTGELRWIVARGDVIRDESGRPIRLVGINVDITERKVVEEERFSLLRAEQAARAEAERSRERLTFLSEATGVLSASLDYNETLQSVTRLAVPEYADICIVDLLEVGRLNAVAVAHADPSAEQLVRTIRRRFLAATAPDDPTRETLRYAQPLMFSDMPTEVLASMAVDDEHLALLQQLDVTSGIIVPLL